MSHYLRKNSTVDNKAEYSAFIKSINAPLFYLPWYLDAVCQDGSWNVAMASENDNIVAVWPYYKKKKFGISYLTLPPMTPFLGPFIVPPSLSQKEHTRLSYEKKILNELVDNLPRSILQISQGTPEWKNWQPLSWRGYSQTTRYTYRINLLKAQTEIWNNMSDKTKHVIKKAKEKVIIQQEESPIHVYQLLKESFNRKSLEVPIAATLFASLDASLTENKAKYCVTARSNGKKVATAYMAFDLSVAYLLVTGRSSDDPGGAVALLIWECIQKAKKMGLKLFDFEGSMIEGIESFFRSFGGEQTPYNRVYRTSGKGLYMLLKMLNRL